MSAGVGPRDAKGYEEICGFDVAVSMSLADGILLWVPSDSEIHASFSLGFVFLKLPWDSSPSNHYFGYVLLFSSIEHANPRKGCLSQHG